MEATPLIWFCIIGSSTMIVMVPYCIISFLNKKQKRDCPKIKSFIVSEYYDRIESAVLDILDAQKPVDQTIILWWGLDGLRMNDDCSLEWISKRKPETINQNVYYQPTLAMAQVNYPIDCRMDMCQSTRAQIDALQMQNAALQMQAAQQQTWNAIRESFLQSYVVPAYSYRYDIYGGSGGAGGMPYSSLYGCCCNQTILR